MDLPILCKVFKKKEVYGSDVITAILKTIAGAIMLIMAVVTVIVLIAVAQNGMLHTLPAVFLTALIETVTTFKVIIIFVVILEIYIRIMARAGKWKIAECPLNKE